MKTRPIEPFLLPAQVKLVFQTQPGAGCAAAPLEFPPDEAFLRKGPPGLTGYSTTRGQTGCSTPPAPVCERERVCVCVRERESVCVSE